MPRKEKEEIYPDDDYIQTPGKKDEVAKEETEKTGPT
jgi:hypothetical protein